MSNRTLIEINHDFAHAIDAGGAGDFERALLGYLRSASKESAKRLEFYGVRVLGMRHHSENFDKHSNVVVLANRILDRPNGDPDDDLAVLSRSFLRECEANERLEERLRVSPPSPTAPARSVSPPANS